MKKLDPTSIENILSLTPLQEGMLFHYLNDPGSDLYFEQLSLELSGPIDVRIFEKAWNAVSLSNEMLRTVFRWEKLEKPSQVVLKEHRCEIRFHNFSDMDNGQKKTVLATIKNNDRNEGFDLTHVPFRVTLCKLSEKEYEMIISNHHIIYDGWSNGIILKLFFNTYDALSKGKQPPPLYAKLSFKEYIKWLQSRDKNKQEQYWKNYLAGFENPTELPIKRKKEYKTGTEDYSLILGEDIQSKLNIFIKNNRVTLAVIFYAAWGILLHKYCSNEDVIFGTTVSGRTGNLKGIEDVAGLFINTIPLRIQAISDEKLKDIIFQTNHLLQEREEFENTPLVDIGIYSRSSLFDTIVAIENYPLDNHLVPGDCPLSITSYTMRESTHYDISVSIVPFNKIEINFKYKQAYFEHMSIVNLAGYFKTIIQTIIEKPGMVLSQLEIISQEEKNRILYEFNNTARKYPTNKTIQQLFAEQAERTPDYIAVFGRAQTRADTENNVVADLCVCPSRNIRNVSLTYYQLNEQSSRLAGLLIEKGVLPGSIVAIMMERCLNLVIGILGILKAGGAYVPINPGNPAERTEFILKESRAKLLAVANGLEGRKVSKWEGEKVHLEEIIPSSQSPSYSLTLLSSSLTGPGNIAYIIYTSGSTGKPKGVVITHSNLSPFLHWGYDVLVITGHDRSVQNLSYFFDWSVWEIFITLTSGASLYLPANEVILDAEQYQDFICRHAITVLHITPTQFQSLLHISPEGKLNSLKYLFIGAEKLTYDLVERSFEWLPKDCRVFNMYGPTEATIITAVLEIQKSKLPLFRELSSVPIGKKLANNFLLIYNRYRHLCPIWVPGELYIGGDGIAQGYLNNPELTAEKFDTDVWDKKDDRDKKNIFSKRAPIVYKTGDLARWLPDGNIEFLGRIDFQVKIRGFRVELGEIENMLLKHTGIKDVVVILKEAENRVNVLAAYFVSDAALSEVALREYLLNVLPDYMVPAYFIRLDRIPLNANGKIDTAALPVPSADAANIFSAPQDEIEKKLAEIWADILDIDRAGDRIGTNENFFHLGGHSLKVTSLASRIYKEFNVKIPLGEIFKKPTIRGLFDYIKAAVDERFIPVEIAEKKEYYKLSSAQKRLYFLQQLDNAGTAYNISAAWILKGNIDKPGLEQSMSKLIQRHESLRTSFVIINKEPVQLVQHVPGIPGKILAEHFQKQLPEDGQSLEAKIRAFIRPFDLSKAPLMRLELIKLTDDTHLFVLDMHHIISDEISAHILLQDFAALYAGKELTEMKLQYKDYAEWQNREKGSRRLLEQGKYWEKEYEGDIPVLELPIDKARYAVQDFEGHTIKTEINAETVKKLKTLALEIEMTLYMLLLALYNVLLAKITNQEDIVIGTPTAGRRHTDLEKIVGMFVNTLALRTNPSGDKKFIDFLKELKEIVLKGFENQEYQYEDLLEKIRVNRGTGRNPLFDTMFALQNADSYKLELPGLTFIPYAFENKTTKFDLTLLVVEGGNELLLTFEYSTKLFKRETIERFMVYFKNLITGLIENRNRRIGDLEILTGKEKERILFEFNNDQVGYPKDKTIHRLFEEQSFRTPGHIALLGAYEGEEGKRRETLCATSLREIQTTLQITYSQLNEQSNRLAWYLREKGFTPDNIVGIMMEPGIEMIAAILSVLKAGGVYLPMDPAYPAERIRFMLADSGSKFLLSSTVENDVPIIARGPYEKGNPPCINKSSDGAYVIYTSGTTGKPKGVVVEHRNLISLMKAGSDLFGYNCRDVWTMFHSFCFDFSVWEMYGALLYGGRLIVIPKMTARDPGLFLQVLLNQKVTILNQTPSAFYNLIAEALKNYSGQLCLRYVIFGGESLKPARLKAWRQKYPEVKLVNMFGITETCVHVTYKEIGEPEIEGDISNIGQPIPTLRTYIMDRFQKLTPIGTQGELHVGGEGLARGYLNRPELTAERFQLNRPYNLNYILYKSGDLARMGADGEMVYMGRIDRQVQLRGFRIELGEIESRLLKHGNIKEAIIIERSVPSGNLYLCAYIVPRTLQPGINPPDLEVTDLREFLAKQLPGYMIPSYFVTLERIPLTANGKIDRSKLPEPLVKIEKIHALPRNKTEKDLADIWQNILGLKKIGIEDNFFDAGGDSIKAIRLISQINERLNCNLKIADLYAHSNIDELAKLVNLNESKSRQALYNKITSEFEFVKAQARGQLNQGKWNPNDIEDIYPMSDIEKGLVFYYMKHLGLGIYHDQFVYSIKYKNFDPGFFKQALTLLVKKHEILRTGFNIEEFAEPMHMVYREPRLNFFQTDLSCLTKDQQQEQIQRLLEEDRHKPFEILNPPLWRMHIYALGNEEFFLIFIFHHAILDGWSMAAFMTELHITYNELKKNSSYVPIELKSSYQDMVIQERIEKEHEWNLQYWKAELQDYTRLEFSEGIKSKDEMAAMKIYSYDGGPEILERSRQAAANWNTHIKNLFFSAFAYMIRMFSYENDIVVGCVTHNRTEKPDGDKVLGCFLNTIPVRLRIPVNITWKEYAAWLEKKMLGVKKYEHLPLFEIALQLGEKNKDRNPFFDTLFNFTDFHIYRQFAGFDAAAEDENEITYNKNDSLANEGHQDTNTLFDFEVDITFKNLFIRPKYNAQVISNNMVRKCCVYFLNILEKYINAPDTIAHRDDILPMAEKEHLLYHFNDTGAYYSREKTMHLLFEEQVLKTKDNTAVIDIDGLGHISYGELNERANRLGNGLRKMGVAPGDFVGVVLERSIEMVMVVMGILKAGGAYVPLEPYLPGQRIEKILESLQTKCVITDPKNRSRFESMSTSLEYLKHIISLDKVGYRKFINNSRKNPAPLSGPGDIAYIIYTSGSTGTPKGVVETHRPVVNVIEWVNKTFAVGQDDKLLFVASLGFDLSVYDIFGILASGASLRIVETKDMKEPLRLLDIMIKEGITFWDSAPAALQQLVPFFNEIKKAGEITKLRLVFLSGDWIPVSMPDALRDTFKGVWVISLGGATEATIWSNYYPIGKVNPDWLSIPYGKPIQNAKYYILDTGLNLCPINIAGDLYIGGECLAKEYKNDPVLTAAKFIDNPYCAGEPGEKIYKTGDIARWFEDGNMQFLGRKDHQVKIRGYRIELGEIENHLASFPGIQEAIAVDRKDGNGNKYICAYYTVKKAAEKITREELLSHLSKELPEYMMPAYFILIDQIPVTANGKLDRKALPEPEFNAEETYRAPENELQKKISAIWKEVLFRNNEGRAQIGIDDDFFELGGHSLSATVVIAKIHKMSNVKVPLTEMFKRPTIRELAAVIEKSIKERYTGIKIVEKKEYYPLSPAQKRLYVLQQLSPESTVYNLPILLQLEGILDKERIKETFQKLLERHESLRTSFSMLNDEPIQRIHDKVEFEIEYKNCNLSTDYTDYADYIDDKEDKIHHSSLIIQRIEHSIQFFIRPFDLLKAPLLRVTLLKENENIHILMVDMHHIISDGTSIGIVVKDFMDLYQRKNLPGLTVQYKDFSEWRNNEKQKELIKQQEDFWLKEFAEEISPLELPIDYPRPMFQSFEGNSIYFEIDKETTKALKKLILAADVTMYMILLAFYNIFLAKVTNQEDIVVGSVIAGRRHADLEKIIGMFVNTFALRSYPVGEKTFNGYLLEIKKKTLSAFENQDYQFEDLVEKIVTERDASRNPLFNVMFDLQNIEIPGIKIPGLTIKPYEYDNKTAKFDLTLTALEKKDNIFFTFEYSTKLFKEGTIQRFIVYFKNIVNGVILDKNRRISEFEIITEEEKGRILFEFNDTAADYPRDETIDQLFTEQASRTPDKIAIIGAYEDEEKKRRRKEEKNGGVETLRATSLQHQSQITYRQLNEQSSRLARLLIERGVLPDTIVGIMMERSVNMINGIFGILKSGGAYLPIDPEYPQERIKYMLQDSKAGIVVNSEFLMDVPQAPFLHHSSFIIQHSDTHHLAYIIYTSGTTGKPKGVMVNHRSVVNRLYFVKDQYRLDEKDVVLQKTSIIFDVSVCELFRWILPGAKLCLLEPGGEKEPGIILKIIARHCITTVDFVPSMLGVFLEYLAKEKVAGKWRTLRWVFTGAEILHPEVAASFAAIFHGNCYAHLINAYGPSEATVDVTYFDYSESKISALSVAPLIPIGRPMANIKIFILDKSGHFQPIGGAGELYISGEGLARGYLNNPELTEKQFKSKNEKLKSKNGSGALWANFHSPFTTHPSPLYHTGDLARWLPDGNIQFLGRIDQQIKIRGFRVELAEIQNRLIKYRTVKDAAVLVRTNGEDKYLCAYIVLKPEDQSISKLSSIPFAELKEFLSRDLPDYMIPSYFVPLDEIPLTPNGKIDRKALPEPELSINVNYVAPCDEIEKKLVEIWSDVLGRDELQAMQLKTSIGIDDNFFQLGGHSLKAMILVSKIHKEFDVKIPLAEIFRSPTIKGLSGYIRTAGKVKYAAIEPIEKKEYYEMSHAQVRLWILDRVEKDLVAYNIPGYFQLEELNRRALERAVETLIKRHEILRTTFITIDGEPKQKVHEYKDLDFNIPYFDLRSDENKDVTVNTFLEAEKNTPFSLETGPLLRTKLLHVEENRFFVLYTMHHIISDQWSMKIMVEEFKKLYEAYENNKERTLVPLHIQYKDYTRWHLEQLTGENLKKHQHYWHNRFKGDIPRLELPTDYPRNQLRSYAGEFIIFSLSKEITGHLKRICKEFGTTLFIILLSVVKVFLYRYTGQTDIIVGTPAAGREHKDLENQIGFYVNMLPLRNQLQGHQNFAEVLQMIDDSTLESLSHQVYPFDLLVHELKLATDMSRSPLVDVVVSFDSIDNQIRYTNDPDSPGTNGRDDLFESGTEASKHDLRLRFMDLGDTVMVHIRYNPQLFKKERILVIKERLIALIKSIIAGIDQKIDDLPFISALEMEKPKNKFKGGF